MAEAQPAFGDRLIFVVGSRRSGTNWMQRVLTAHPDVVGTNGESFLFSRGLVPLLDRFHHGSPASTALGSVYADRARLIGAVRDLCDVVFGDLLTVLGPAERLVDRTPEHVTCLDLIGEVYPEVRVIHIIRDGRDVVRSMLGQPWSPSVSEAVEEWRAAVVDGRREGRKLAHYKEVRYETLVADPEPLFADLFAWLELDLTPAVMEAALREAARPFTVSTDNKKIGSGKWRDDADPAALAELERAAGDVMRELGYVDAGEARAPANIVAAAPVVAAAAVPAGAPATRSPGNPLRTGMARVRALVRPAPANVDALVRRRLQGANRVVHGFLAGMGSRSAEEMLADFEPDAEVRLFGDTVYEGAGEEARRRLLDAVAADPVIGWRQVRSDVVVGIPTTTTITSYEGPDGQAAHRVVAVRVNEQKRITRVTYHCLDG